jgi:hypothetical protein
MYIHYVIENIENLTDETLQKLDIASKLCFDDPEPLKQAQTNMPPNKLAIFVLLETTMKSSPEEANTLIQRGNPILVCRLWYDRDKINDILISDICVPKSHRGQGVLRKAISYLASHYTNPQTTFSLEALNNVRENYDMKKRIEIYAKLGFYIPTENITVKTKSGEMALLVEPIIKNREIRYKIQSADTGKISEVDIKTIDLCFKNETSIMCPMTTNAKLIKEFELNQKGGRKKAKRTKTKHNKSKNKTRRNL